MEASSYFKAEKISASVTRIFAPTGVLMYLIEGSKKAVLIDTGVGIGNLKEFVDTLTDKPYFVILTHGHLDHAMGASQFDEVYMNFEDKKVYLEHSDMSMRKEYIKMNIGSDLNIIKEDAYVPIISSDHFKQLLPGDSFDLGGINIKICIGAGHTKGSITILIVEERTLILGDACNFFTFLFGEDCLGITSYKKSMQELDKETKGLYDRVYLSHGTGDAPKEMLSSVIELCEDILIGNTDDIPFDFLGEKAFIAKEVSFTPPFSGRIDGGLANIVYSKEKINM